MAFCITVVLMTATIIGIIDDGGEWPTISVQGDLDPSSLYTLQGWAFDEFAALAEDSVNTWDLESDGELLIENETTVVDQQIQQTEVNSGWGVTIIYRSRGEFGVSIFFFILVCCLSNLLNN